MNLRNRLCGMGLTPTPESLSSVNSCDKAIAKLKIDFERQCQQKYRVERTNNKYITM